MPSFETQVECPALSEGNLPLVRTLDHCLVSIKEMTISSIDFVRYLYLIYLYVKRKNMDPKSLQE